jgi:hypothetical protein
MARASAKTDLALAISAGVGAAASADTGASGISANVATNSASRILDRVGTTDLLLNDSPTRAPSSIEGRGRCNACRRKIRPQATSSEA